MNGEYSLKKIMTDVFDDLLVSLADLLPRAVIAVLIILLGLVVAKLAERLVRILFERFRIDSFLDRIGVTRSLQKLGLRDTPGRILSRTVYFLLIIFFTQAVTRAVGLTSIADAIGSFIAYLPNLIAAFLVFLLGMMLAQFLGRTVTQSATDAGIDYAAVLGRIVSTFVLFVVVVMAVTQLQIDTQIIRSVVLVMLAGGAIAMALSFGLGTRDVTLNIVAGFYARNIFEVGKEVEMRNQRGVLISITSTQTLIQKGEELVAVPNRVFLEEVVKQ